VAVEKLLAELELTDRPTVLVLNKIDRVDGERALDSLVEQADGVPISAATGAGVDRLLAHVENALRPLSGAVRLSIPYSDGATLAWCYDRGRVLARDDAPCGIRLDVELPAHLLAAVSPYRVDRATDRR
jgi:GTPase